MSGAWWELYGKWHNVCEQCNGDGEFARTDRAAYYPKKYPNEIMKCPVCGGTGKRISNLPKGEPIPHLKSITKFKRRKEGN
jgi:DnaJ-class molecular chaperone